MSEMTYREALRAALTEELERDEKVFVMGEEIGVFNGAYKVTSGLLEKFGEERIIDTPIAEEGFLGAAIGAALLGERPIVEIMTINFLLVAIDQLVNHAAKMRAMFGGQMSCPIVLRTPSGGGTQLTAQHSRSLEGWLASIPGLKVVVPTTPQDAYGLLKSAVRDDDPVVMVENLGLYTSKGEVIEDQLTPIGKAQILREGTDLTIVSHSFSAFRSLKVANRLSEQGLNVEVVDLRSLRPLDMETVCKSVSKTNRVLCVEEGWPSYGVTAELTARIQNACFDDLDAPIERLGSLEVPLPYAKELETACLPNEARIEAAVLDMLS
jgi:pyruvate dehydrogenase E1 component beta subunit